MSFLGRKWHGQFEGEVVTDHAEYPLRGRLPGCRIKHRMKRNWLKMYDKAGWILRVETVINDPEEFRVRRFFEKIGEPTKEESMLAVLDRLRAAAPGSDGQGRGRRSSRHSSRPESCCSGN